MNCDGNQNFIIEMDLSLTMNNIICTDQYMNNTPVIKKKTVLSTANIIKPKNERNGADGSVFFHGQLEMHGVATIYRGERAHTTPILATFPMVVINIITMSIIISTERKTNIEL